MKTKLEQSTEVLSEILEKKIIGNSQSWIEWALDAMLEFKANYEIENCSTNLKTDELLAEYGVYNWNLDKKSLFEFTLIRQILLNGDEEYYPIKLKSTFNFNKFEGMESMSLWAMNFKNLTEWRSKIQQTEGYIKVKEVALLNQEISLNMT